MTEFAEDRVFARHRRRTGAVLIIGAGAVGGFLADDLARLGISPLRLVDPKLLRVENLIRHPLGAEYRGQPKASALASKISLDFSLCDARGLDEDFLELPEDIQRSMVDMADVVVAAADTFACQQRVNQVCLEVGKPAVYPAVWVDPRVRDAEVCEILWVDPSRRTPCYECWVAFRQAEADAQAARGGRIDIKLLALTTAQVVMSLLDPTDQQIAVRDPDRTAMYIHGFTPTSEGIKRTFPTPGLRNLYVRVPFPPTPCPACGSQDPVPLPAPPPAPRLASASDPLPAPQPTPSRQPPPPPPSRPSPLRPPYGFTAPPVRSGVSYKRPHSALTAVTVACAILVVVALGLRLNRPAPVPAFSPNHTKLLCDHSIELSKCLRTIHWYGDTLSLDVRRLTQPVAKRLCRRGYTDRWSDNLGVTPRNFKLMCYSGPGDYSSPGGYLRLDFSPPNVRRHWVITWRLLNPSGRVVSSAKYKVRLVP